MSKVYDAQLKAGHFTAEQNKKDKGEEINTIGELVAICEKEGFIPKYYTDGPQDKVDRVIEDMKQYTQDLVSNETNLDTLFESAQRQMIEEQERIEATAAMGEDINDEDALFKYEVDEMTETDHNEMYDFLEEERQKDLEVM